MSTLTWDEIDGVDLWGQAGEATAPAKDRKMVRISGLANPFEATVLSGVLEDEGILHVIEPHHETAHGPLFLLARSWGSVLVPFEAGERTLQILMELRESFQHSDDESTD